MGARTLPHSPAAVSFLGRMEEATGWVACPAGRRLSSGVRRPALRPWLYLPLIASEGVMNKEDMMPIVAKHEFMWTLSADRKTVRLALPPLLFDGIPERITIYMNCDAETVDAMLERLSILRSQMLPPLPAPNKRN